VTLDLQSGVGSGLEEESITRMIWVIFGTRAWIAVFFRFGRTTGTEPGDAQSR